MRRTPVRAAATLMAVLAVGACGHTSTTTVRATTTTAEGSAPGSGPSTTVSTTGGRPASGRPSATTATTARAGAARPPVTTAPGEDQTVAAGRSGVGSLAPFLMRPQPDPAIVVELLEQTGAAHDQAAVGHQTSVLRSVSGKAVTVGGPVALAGGARSWDESSLSSLADAASRQQQGGGRVVVHQLYVHGTFKGDSTVLGVAVRGDVLAVFVDQLQSSASITLPESELEDVVTMHETGHILGLVDLYLHTGRQDPQHPGHSTNRHSVMYWAVDSSLIGQILGGNPPKDFDSDDLHDLETIKSTT